MKTPLAELSWTACVSALRLDRLEMGELPAAEAEEARAHLAGCARCAGAVAELRADRARARLPELRALPLAPPAPSAHSAPPRPRRTARWAAAGAGLAAAAALALVLRPAVPSERTRGAPVALGMFVQHGSEVRRAGPGDLVAPGDAVRFTVSTPQSAYVAVLSLDPGGAATVYFPQEPRAAWVAAGQEVPLPAGTRLDATVGQEQLFGLFCSSPVELEPVRRALRSAELPLPDGCQVIRWSFTKR
jgi:hypothetical protein